MCPLTLLGASCWSLEIDLWSLYHLFDENYILIPLCCVSLLSVPEKIKNKMILYGVDHLICQQAGLVGQIVPQKMNANFINADKPTGKTCRFLLQRSLKTDLIYSKHNTVLINFFNITISLNLKYMWCFSSEHSQNQFIL